MCVCAKARVGIIKKEESGCIRAVTLIAPRIRSKFTITDLWLLDLSEWPNGRWHKDDANSLVFFLWWRLEWFLGLTKKYQKLFIGAKFIRFHHFFYFFSYNLNVWEKPMLSIHWTYAVGIRTWHLRVTSRGFNRSSHSQALRINSFEPYVSCRPCEKWLETLWNGAWGSL